jgi:DNA-binding response OmpR family regulator
MSRILLVEDDLSLIDGLEFSLCKNGFDVRVARTVRDALAALFEGTFDLLLLDLTLPDGSGFDICKKQDCNLTFRSSS